MTASRSIRGLLLTCRPSDIAWLIVSVIVYAINGVFRRRSRSYVGSKRAEVVAPFITDANAAPAVSRPVLRSRVLLIEASDLHLLPDVIQRGAILAVRSFADACCFAIKATTALDLAIQQLPTAGILHIAAIASAIPSTVCISSQGGEPEEVIARRYLDTASAAATPSVPIRKLVGVYEFLGATIATALPLELWSTRCRNAVARFVEDNQMIESLTCKIAYWHDLILPCAMQRSEYADLRNGK